MNQNARMANGECPKSEVVDEVSTAWGNKPYDLEERTARYGEEVVRFARKVPLDAITRPLVTQLIKAATSVGANYCEADDAESKSDFRHKIGICKKESRETKHFLRMLVAADGTLRERVKPLWQEAKELNLIFGAIRARTGRR